MENSLEYFLATQYFVCAFFSFFLRFLQVVYFTSLFPYIVLTIFFIRAITLKGAGDGLVHMYTPDVQKLANPMVWLDAATQVFYSFGLAFGSLIAFGSYNTPKNHCVRDVLLVSFCNAFTAIYASVVIFSILGFKATIDSERCVEKWVCDDSLSAYTAFHFKSMICLLFLFPFRNRVALFDHNVISAVNVSDQIYESKLYSILKENQTEGLAWGLSPNCSLKHQLSEAAEGTGLAFIVFTQAIVSLPGAPFWAVLFFTMLLSLGLGSQIGLLEGMLCTLFDIDIFKRLRKQYVTGKCVLLGMYVCFFHGSCFING